MTPWGRDRQPLKEVKDMEKLNLEAKFEDLATLVSELETKFDKNRMLPKAERSMATKCTCGPLCDTFV